MLTISGSFFKTIITEALVNFAFKNQNTARSMIFSYIEGWYNTKRIHRELDRKSSLEAFKDKVYILAV